MKKIIYLFTLLLVLACSKEGSNSESNMKNDKENNKQNFTSSNLFTEKLIENFYLNIEDKELIIEFYEKQNKVDFNNSDLLKFSPSNVNGDYSWKDEYTLIFTFSKVNMDTNYKVDFSLKTYLNEEYKDLSFLINFEAPKIKNINLRKKINAQDYFFEFIIDFDREVTKELINSNIKLALPKGTNYKNLQIEKVEAINNSKTKFRVISSKFKEDIDRQKVELKFFEQIIEEYFSYNTDGLRTYNFRENNNKFSLYLNFNTNEINEENLASFININELEKFHIKVVNNAIIISGDFISGKEYEVRLFAPIASLDKDEIFKVKVPNLQPIMEFKNEGIYLAKDNQNLRLRTRNLKGFNLSIKKVNKDNLGFFINNYGLESGTKGQNRYDSYSLIRFGTELYSEKINLDTELNKWLNTDIDLSILGEKYDKRGIYLVEVSFDPEDILVPLKGYEDENKNKDAYNNYSFANYLYTNGHISKTVVLSDIGIITKKTSDRLFVYTSDLSTGKAMDGVEVSLINNKGTRKIYTNHDGLGIFNIDSNENWELILAEKDGEISFINQYNDYINYSLADNSGIVKKSGTDAFIYTERGVYRPGDSVYISSIIFEEDKKLPENLPLLIKIYNPLGKQYAELKGENLGNNLYAFKLDTQMSDPTGKWKIDLFIGELLIKSQFLSIETIVPPVIRVKNTLDSKVKNTLNVEIFSEYLFGMPSKNLNYNTQLELRLARNPFTSYQNFSFVNQILEDSSYNNQYRSGVLDENGKAMEEFDLFLNTAPFKLDLFVTSDIFQKDGRKVSEADVYTYDFYDRYVGIENFDAYGEIGEKIKLKTILLNKDGSVLKDKLSYNIYKNDTYWWWDYASYDDYRKHYKKSEATLLIESGDINSGDSVEFNLEEYGNYYLEIVDKNGHKAGTFIKSGYYSYGSGSTDSFMKLELNKKQYEIGEEVQVTFDSPSQGYGIINIEKGQEILESRRIEIKEGLNTFKFIPKENYFPGVYVNVIILQNLKEKLEGTDIRLQGLQYIKLEKKNKEIKSKLLIPEIYHEPNKIYVGIETDVPNASFTLAVVDEGLLSITRYQSPNPYSYFYGKEKYRILNYDNYKHILDINKDKAYKTLKPGGGEYRALMAEEMLSKKSDAGVNEVKRFKAISYFKTGKTDENGKANVLFELDEYMGELRFMLVTSKDGAFGNDSKSAKVRGDIVMYPGLPRTLAPNDTIVSNLTLFINEVKDKKAKVGVKLEGPLVLLSPYEIDLDGSEISEKNFEFRIKALNKTGVGKITYYFQSGDFRRESSVDIAINTQAPYLSYKEEYELEAGTSLNLKIHNEAVQNSSNAQIRVSRYPLYNLYGRLQYLIRYPYGCLEQTVSSVFPQLYLSKFLTLSNEEWQEINKNINEGIKRIEKFQLSDGSLSYWQNETYTNQWSSSYAYYFLIEAKKNGYYVPEYLLENLENFQFKTASNTREVNLTSIHRLYVLALGNKPNINAMNYYRQNKLKELTKGERFLLAGAYKLAGYEDTAKSIIEGIDYEVKDTYWEENFGSQLRDKAIILDVLSKFQKNKDTDTLNLEILNKLAGKDWYSTQTLAYSLLAVSNYKEDTSNNKELGYEYKIAGRSFKDTLIESNTLINIDNYLGKEVEFNNLSDEKLYINYLFQGKMNLREQKNYAKEIRLSAQYYDDDGNIISNLSSVDRGNSIWAVYRVEKQRNKQFNNLALYQNLPSGLEIENLRLTGAEYPSWVYNVTRSLANVRSTDIRDDKIVWFFDMQYGTETYFVLKLNAVTKGNFFMPGAVVEAMYSDEIGSGLEGRSIQIK